MTQKSALTKQLTMMDDDLNEILRKVKESQTFEEQITQQQSKLKTEKVNCAHGRYSYFPRMNYQVLLNVEKLF